MEERILALMCHVGGWMTAMIVPLVLWLVKRRSSAFVDHHGKESLNFQLFLTLAYAALFAAGAVVGVLYWAGSASQELALIGGLGCGIVFAVLSVYEALAVLVASIASLDGRPFRYPVTIRFVR
jgi:uncharacterized Tic20 family protein